MKSADGRFEYLDERGDPVPEISAPQDVHRFAFRCRHSERSGWCSVNLRGRGHDIPQKSWAWNGDIDRPTLSPSINCADCWHGYIENGVFVTTNKAPEPKQ